MMDGVTIPLVGAVYFCRVGGVSLTADIQTIAFRAVGMQNTPRDQRRPKEKAPGPTVGLKSPAQPVR